LDYCGFQSSSHFSRSFSKFFGMSPSQWASKNP
jgi:AraC-like DNA-binding protein